MAENPDEKSHVRICPDCNGTGQDKSLHRRFTSGGHDDRRCERCNGECYIQPQEVPKKPMGVDRRTSA
jgi:DnaJ-class molecular chaperone